MEPDTDTGPDAGQDIPQDAAQDGGQGSEPLDQAFEIGESLLSQGREILESLLRPWNAYQIGIAAAVLVAAWLLTRLLGPRIRAWMAARHGWPT